MSASLKRRFFELYKSVLGTDRKVIYLSSPIATGDRLTAFNTAGYNIKDHPDIFAEQVIYPNKAQANYITERLRKQYPNELFLNPAEPGRIDEWSYDDYNTFWLEVIKSFAKQNWMLPGWENSIGCNLEKQTSEGLGLPIRYVEVKDKNINILRTCQTKFMV